MARKTDSTIQEELYSTGDDVAREEMDDARLLELNVEKESPFLRGQKRVSARRSPLPKKTASRLLWLLLVLSIAAIASALLAALYQYGQHSWRFRLETSDNIEMVGLSNVTRTQVMEVMGGDIGRNVFFIPLEQRQKQLEQIAWVESASVLRFAPNRIRIEIHERTPVAFARVGSRIILADRSGALMELSLKRKYSFPVIVGMSAGEPIATRAARMKIYSQLIHELDSGGGHYSEDLSEVDLSDPEDVKVLTNDPGGEVLIHLGSSNYLDRFKIYIAHLGEWRQQFVRLESVDLRYDRQIIVNPDRRGTERRTPLSPAAARAARSAGVKLAALEDRLATKTPGPGATPVKATALKHAEKTAQPGPRKVHQSAPARWHKHPGPAPHPAYSTAPAVPSSQVTPGSQKPSPAILKGSQGR